LRPTSRQQAASCRQTTQLNRFTHPVSRPQFKQGKIKVPGFIARLPHLAGRGKVRLDSPAAIVMLHQWMEEDANASGDPEEAEQFNSSAL